MKKERVWVSERVLPLVNHGDSQNPLSEFSTPHTLQLRASSNGIKDAGFNSRFWRFWSSSASKHHWGRCCCLSLQLFVSWTRKKNIIKCFCGYETEGEEEEGGEGEEEEDRGCSLNGWTIKFSLGATGRISRRRATINPVTHMVKHTDTHALSLKSTKSQWKISTLVN